MTASVDIVVVSQGRPRNDLYCVGRDAKPYSLTHSHYYNNTTTTNHYNYNKNGNNNNGQKAIFI